MFIAAPRTIMALLTGIAEEQGTSLQISLAFESVSDISHHSIGLIKSPVGRGHW